jgi:hypothetical protein
LAILLIYDSTLQCEYITPRNFMGSTSMTDQDPSIRHFCYLRYAELVENPIMYSKTRLHHLNVDGMDIFN